jgi:dihydrofolate synthase/folylpolyglutamate synthase
MRAATLRLMTPMNPPRTLDDWLAHCERLHPKSIDMTLDRVNTVRDRLALRFHVPVITVAGTNGKGSTCAMLESILRAAGFRTGLYIKPHLVHFEERCRIDGDIAKAEDLVPHFEAVEAARGDLTLTYFEFTTLAILRALSIAPIDVVILEVGLGGRLDAVNAIDADCAVITSIDIDHVEYLGPDRESIGREKAGIARAGRPLVVGDPVPPQSVIDAAQAVGADLWRFGVDFNYSGDRQQWSWSGRGRRLHALGYPALRGANQLLNAAGALAALETLRDRVPVTAQAVRTGLATVELPGRFQIIPGQPALVLDVAHNPHSVAALALNLDQMGYFPRTFAVFGVMHDKDLDGILGPLLPLIDRWHVCGLPIARAAKADELAQRVGATLARHPRTAGAAPTVTPFADPQAALAAALEAADPTDRIVVFGSFYTVGGVLKDGPPRLAARHLG